MKRKKIAIFGSTGSIGTNALEVIRKSLDCLEVFGLAINSNIEKLEQQVQEFSPKIVVIYESAQAEVFSKKYPEITVLSGAEGLNTLAQEESVDFALMAMSGNKGIEPLVHAIKSNKQIGLANKEVLVAAGQYITTLAKEHGVNLIPIDSEHSAIFQCLQGESKSSIKRLILTASGGPFRNFTSTQLKSITPAQALKHPTWQMGKKITIDSSTLMNKGLEIIEAHWLFDIPIEMIDVIVHPESIVHSMVEFVDGSIKAQLSQTSMQMPIHYALFYPHRETLDIPAFDFTKHHSFSFEKPKMEEFICLQLAIDAIKAGKSMPCFMNAANDVLVERFLNNEISWQDIGIKLQRLMSLHQLRDVVDLEDILSVDKQGKELAKTV